MVKKELYDNLSIDRMCILAIEDAMEEENYTEAEKLCLTKTTKFYNRYDPKDWNNLLYDIYEKTNNREKQVKQARKLLLFGNEEFWNILKGCYTECGTWNENKESILDELKNSNKTDCYRSILVEEKETKRLLESIIKNPYGLFYYGEYIVKDYPNQVYELCYKEIVNNCIKATNRKEYRKVAEQIEQLIKWNGNDTAKVLIDELKQKYPKKNALAEELEKAAKNI